MMFKYIIREIHCRQHLKYLERKIVGERDNTDVTLKANQEISTRVREAHATQGLLEADFFQKFCFSVPDFNTPVIAGGREQAQCWTCRELEQKTRLMVKVGSHLRTNQGFSASGVCE